MTETPAAPVLLTFQVNATFDQIGNGNELYSVLARDDGTRVVILPSLPDYGWYRPMVDSGALVLLPEGDVNGLHDPGIGESGITNRDDGQRQSAVATRNSRKPAH